MAYGTLASASALATFAKVGSAATVWTAGYFSYNVAFDNTAQNTGGGRLLGFAGDFLGYNQVRNALDEFHSATTLQSRLGHFTSGVAHASLGINFAQTALQFFSNVTRHSINQFRGVSIQESIQNVATRMSFGRDSVIPRIKFTQTLLPSHFMGYVALLNE